MKRLAAAVAALILLAAPARATEWMVCSDAGGKATISVLLGAMNVIAVAAIKIDVDGKIWSTVPGEGTSITKGQAFEADHQLMLDVTDAEVSEIIAQLRLFEATEGNDVVAAGTLRMPGLGAWAVTCEGP